MAFPKELQRAEILEGRVASSEIKREVAEQVRRLKVDHDVTPRLAAVLVGEDPASAVYVRNKIKACDEVGIASEHIGLPATTSTDELLTVVRSLNDSGDVDGILVQLPLPKQI